jgi:hypothetical protein
MGRLSAGSRRALMVVVVVGSGLMVWLNERLSSDMGLRLFEVLVWSGAMVRVEGCGLGSVVRKLDGWKMMISRELYRQNQ